MLRCTLLRLARRLGRPLEGQAGQFLPMLAAFMGMAAVGGAMVLDMGMVYGERRDAQNDVDKAALAGGADLPDQNAARTHAEQWLELNGFDLDDPDVTYDVTFPDTYEIEVRITRTRPTFLLGVFGMSDIDVGARAVAARVEEPVPYTLMAMHESACAAMFIEGQAIAEVTGGGGTYTRSDCAPDALLVQGQAQLLSGRNDVVGEAATSGSGATIDLPANEGALPVDDPFADVDTPPRPPACYAGPYSISQGDVTLPGNVRYCQRLQISGQAHVRLAPGVYWLEHGMSLDGNGGAIEFTSDGDPVLFYNTCPSSPCNGSRPEDIYVAGSVTGEVKGHPDYDHIVIWVDRTAGTESNPPLVQFAGSALGVFEGSTYNISGETELAGSSSADVTLNMSVVSRWVNIRGNGRIVIPYDASTAPTWRVLSLIE